MYKIRHTLQILIGGVAVLLILIVIGVASTRGQQRYEDFYQSNRSLSFAELRKKGHRYIIENKEDSAIVCYMMMTSRYNEHMPDSDKVLVANAYNNMAYIYSFVRTDYSRAYSYLLEALSICAETGDDRLPPYAYINIGNIYGFYDDMKGASDAYQKAAQLAVKAKEWKAYLVAAGNIGDCLVAEDEGDAARSLLHQFDSLQIPDQPMLMTHRNTLRALVAYFDGNMDEARSLLQESIDNIDTDENPERYKAGLYDLLGNMYAYRRMFNDAIRYYSLADSVSKAIDSPDLGHCERELAAMYDSIGNRDLMIEHSLKYMALRDSIFSEQNYGNIHELHSNYELQNFQRKLQEENDRRQVITNICILSGVFAIVLLILLISIVRKNHRLNESIASLYSKNQEIEKLEEEKYKNSSLNDDMKQQLVVKVKEALSDREILANTELTIARLAEILETNEKYVSQAVNEVLGKNFSTLLSEYRVREVQRLMQNKEQMGHLTLEAIAQQAGFKNRSTFSSVFKKVTGLTPSEYQKQAQGRDKM